jgi:hypothetical protein
MVSFSILARFARSHIRHAQFFQLFALAFGCLLAFKLLGVCFQGQDLIGGRFLKALEVDVLDKLRQRRFPRLLFFIGQLAEFVRIKAQLAGHLHLGIAQVVALPGIDPNLKLLWQFIFLHGVVCTSWADRLPVGRLYQGSLDFVHRDG